MKTTPNPREVTTNLTSQAFQLGDIGLIFNLLATKIYTDAPRAVVREVCCNALDIHRSTGNQEPFLVSLPSSVDPSFSVRDKGTGLSHDLIMGLYTTVGMSTKGDDNEQIGGFGLGTKAPFSYSDSFTITSTQDGVKSIYAAFRDPKGLPVIAPAGEFPTDDPNGLEVKVPIKREDWDMFTDKALDVLRWFPAGSVKLFGADLVPLKIAISNPTWMTVRDLHYNYVMMGPVAYRVDWRQADVAELHKSIVPIFDVGDLELPPSREGLIYSDDTIAALKARYEQICLEYPVQALAEAELLGPLERLDLVADLRASGLASIFETYHKLMGHREPVAEGEKREWGPFLRTSHELLTLPVRGAFYEYGKARRSSVYRAKFGGNFLTKAWNHRPSNDTIFVRHDLQESKTPKIIDRLQNLRNWKTANLVTHGWEHIDALFPDDRKFVLSELEPVFRPKKVRVKKSQLVHVKRARSNGFKSSHSVYDMPDDDDDCVYVPFNNHEMDGDWWPWLGTAWAWEAEIHGLTKTTTIQPHWVRIDDWVKAKVAEALANPTCAAALSADWVGQQIAGPLTTMVKARGAGALFNLMPAATTAWWNVLQDQKGLDDATRTSLRNLEVKGLVKLPRPKDTHGFIRKMKSAEKRNPALVFLHEIANRSRSLNVTSGTQDHVLKAFVR